MNFKGDFSEASETNKSVMRPGIVYSIDRYPFNWVRAKKLDSRAGNKRIGRTLGALHSAGLTESRERNSSYTTYEVSLALEPEGDENSLMVALGEAEKRFHKSIEKALSKEGRDENAVVEEVLSHEIETEMYRGEERLKVLKDYSDDTVNFFNDIGLVEDLEDLNLRADDEDIDYLRENIHLLL